MTLRRKELGKLGEDIAAAYLEKLGYVILQRNFSTRTCEIDIVAKDGETTVFTEVKTLASANQLEDPVVNVTRPKQKQVIHAAKVYIAQAGEDIRCRFDVIGVIPGREPEVEHFIGAFCE